jgi:phosphocarrier protein HPr
VVLPQTLIEALAVGASSRRLIDRILRGHHPSRERGRGHGSSVRRRQGFEALEDRRLLAAFSDGNLAVYRVGTGAAALTAGATAVFVDEYPPSGTLMQSVALSNSLGPGRDRAGRSDRRNRRMLSPQDSRIVHITDPQGLHLRPCSAIARTVGRYQAVVTVQKGSQAVAAASIFGLLSLAAAVGTRLVVSATGPDAREALQAVVELLSTEQELAHCG